MRIILVGLFVVFLCGSGLSAGEFIGRWEELPLPPSKHKGVSAIGMEPGGVLWLMANNSLYYWAGQQFQPLDGELTSGQYLTSLYGGPDRGLYATQRGEEEPKGKLYKLTDGQAIYVTDFYYEVSHEYPGLYVSKSGRLFNWGNRFLAVYLQDRWKRIEAPLSLRVTLIFDTGEKVYFYYNQNIYSVGNYGNFDKCNIAS